MYDCGHIKFPLKGSLGSFNERITVMIIMNLAGFSAFSACVCIIHSFIYSTYIEHIPYSPTVLSTGDKHMNNILTCPWKVHNQRKTDMYKCMNYIIVDCAYNDECCNRDLWADGRQ